jgi:hypothetical protein
MKRIFQNDLNVEAPGGFTLSLWGPFFLGGNAASVYIKTRADVGRNDPSEGRMTRFIPDQRISPEGKMSPGAEQGEKR